MAGGGLAGDSTGDLLGQVVADRVAALLPLDELIAQQAAQIAHLVHAVHLLSWSGRRRPGRRSPGGLSGLSFHELEVNDHIGRRPLAAAHLVQEKIDRPGAQLSGVVPDRGQARPDQ